MIKLENVSFQYKNSVPILNNLNLTINEGEIIAIVGKNGAGKSTIGKLIAGILKLKQGSITIDDLPVSENKNKNSMQNKVGIVFQNPENQIIFNNIYDEISFSLKGISSEEIENRIDKALVSVEMLDFKNSNLYDLSLGQKQRMMIAEILTRNPKYIVLDEPTTMIDSLGKDKIYEIIKKLKLQGYTIICITNLADEILLADRILILDKGNISTEIKKEELVQKIDCLKKYGIKVPLLLEILSELNLDLKEYTVPTLLSLLKGKYKE